MPPPEPISDTLRRVSAASQGDADAVDALLAQFVPDLVRHIGRNAGGLLLARETPEDLAQSVCRELLESLRSGRFRFQGESAFREWLYRAATMKLIDRHRRWTAQRRDGAREMPLGPADTPSGETPLPHPESSRTPSRAASESEDLERFQAAYAELPERQREILRLHHVEGLPHGAIAAQLGISESNSRMLLSRALARIGRRLAGA